MTSTKPRQWVVRMLLAAGVLLALVAAAPEAQAGFQLSIGTGGFYFSVGHNDYYPYYSQPAHYGGYAATSFSFYNTLGDYGYWQYLPEMGMQVWIPYVEYGWRPYTYGHWTYSSYGWTWVAYEPWGWIPHHYGNWTYVDHYGWAWVPGYTWRPHCVQFAVCNGYIGWAPMAPPWYRYHSNRGYRYHGDRGWYSGWRHGHQRHEYSGIDYSTYVFVDNRNFYGTAIQQHALLPGSGAEMFRAGQVMPLGETLDLDYVRRVSRQSITPVALDRQVYKVNGSEVVHYQPRGQEDLVRDAALPTVNRVLAPGFQKHGVSFKGSSARSAGSVNSMFQQGNVTPRTTTFKQSAVSRGMANDEYYQKQKRTLDNLSRSRASNSGAADTASPKGRQSSKSVERSSPAGTTPVATAANGRSSGYKPRSGAQAGSQGSSSPGKSRSISRGASTSGRNQSVSRGGSSPGRSRTVTKGSASSTSRNRSVSKPPASTRTAPVPPRKPSKPAGSASSTSRNRSVSKPPASTRTAPVPPRKPSKPARTSGSSRASRSKPAGKAAGKPSGKPSAGEKSADKGKSGKRN